MWPCMIQDFEAKVMACDIYQSRSLDPPVSMHPLEWPQKPWSRLCLDNAGSLFEKMCMILIDAHSK